MGRRLARGCALACLVLLTLGCGESRRYDQAVSVLIDVSGTYADQKSETVKLIKGEILPHMLPGDTLLVVRIDSESYDRGNVEALVTLDRRPSHAQKLALARKLDAFAVRHESSKHTDIPGAIMLASEYLQEIAAGSSTILLFSDLQEDLPRGTVRTLRPDELANTHIAAMNVKRLKGDTLDPEVFRGRLAAWEARLKNAGAVEWRTFMDASRLPEYLATIRG
jgi:hypothetical protein